MGKQTQDYLSRCSCWPIFSFGLLAVTKGNGDSASPRLNSDGVISLIDSTKGEINQI